MVIERWSPRWVEIIDPAAGRRRIHATEFDAAFTGVIVMLEPGIGFLRRRAAGQISWLCYMRASLARISGLLQMFAKNQPLPKLTRDLVNEKRGTSPLSAP